MLDTISLDANKIMELQSRPYAKFVQTLLLVKVSDSMQEIACRLLVQDYMRFLN